MTRPRVTLCIPVYRAEAFIDETLAAASAQDYPALDILISVDAGDDNSAAICRAWIDGRGGQGPPARVISQPRRLGWVANCNHLIALAEGDYVGILPHDDLIPPDYAGRLAAELDAHPEAVCAYPAIESFGDLKGTPGQPSLTGPRFARVLTFVERHFNGVSFRGLVRRAIPDSARYLLADQPGDYAVDTLWILQKALVGELRQVPELLYRKRMHAGSVHAGWSAWPVERRLLHWAAHAGAVARLARPAAGDERERAALDAACRRRLLGEADCFRPFADADLTRPRRRSMEAVFEAARSGARPRIPSLLPDADGTVEPVDPQLASRHA